MAKKSYPGGFRLTLKTARALAVQEFGTCKGLKQASWHNSMLAALIPKAGKKLYYGHIEMHNPELAQKIEAVEKALGFKLFVWQKAFIARGEFRRMGATTAEILKDLLDVSALPIDYSERERNYMERLYRRELLEIKLKLDEAGIPTRTVFFSKKDKWEYFADKKEGK